MLTLARALLAASLAFALPESSPAQTVDVPTHASPSSRSPDLYSEAMMLRYADLARDLPQVPSGLEHDLFAGVLANRTSQFDQSIRLLTPISLTTDVPRNLMALALGALADDYVRTFHYALASSFYDRLLGNYADVLPSSVLKDTQDDADTLKLLLDAPPQTIDIAAPIDLPTHTDPLGSITVNLTAHNVTTPWILDTGASISVVSESFARQLGLTFSSGIAHAKGASGLEIPFHVAILDTLTIGTATVHNVVLLVLPDAKLKFRPANQKPFVIDAILGYPVFQALGILRFTEGHRFLAGAALPLTGDSSPLYLQSSSILLSCKTHHLARPFLFDSGAPTSALFFPYASEFSNDLLHEDQRTLRGCAVGGKLKVRVYLRAYEELELTNRTIDLETIPVFQKPQNSTLDQYEGILGRDFLHSFDTFTLDLIHDRVYPGKPRN